MEAVFRPEIFWIFSDDFRLVPDGTDLTWEEMKKKKVMLNNFIL
jgi:hypothetical protein